MKTTLALVLGLTALGLVRAATPDTEQPKCSKGFQEARVDRITAGVVSYTTSAGKKGAMPQGATGARSVGEVICLPATDIAVRGAATSTR